MTRKPPACTTSWRHDAQNAGQPCSACGSPRDDRASARPSGRDRSAPSLLPGAPGATPAGPAAATASPSRLAVSRLATNRAATIAGSPGNATAVDTSTTGLIAGEASRNANAAAGATPRRMSAPATGTEPHSQAGSAAPAMPATGTAATGLRGSARSKNRAGTNAVIAADSSVPRTRNGSACTMTETKTVTNVDAPGEETRSTSQPRSNRTTSTTTASISTDPRRRRHRDAGVGRTFCLVRWARHPERSQSSLPGPVPTCSHLASALFLEPIRLSVLACRAPRRILLGAGEHRHHLAAEPNIARMARAAQPRRPRAAHRWRRRTRSAAGTSNRGHGDRSRPDRRTRCGNRPRAGGASTVSVRWLTAPDSCRSSTCVVARGPVIAATSHGRAEHRQHQRERVRTDVPQPTLLPPPARGAVRAARGEDGAAHASPGALSQHRLGRVAKERRPPAR